MITRRSFLQSGAVAAAFAVSARAARADTPGVTDSEIKIGQTMPYSGPASAYGVIGRTEAAYFKMINEQGGVSGRKINLISLDDGYSPPKTVEQVRRLVEDEKVAFLFQTLGTAPNLAIRQYLNDNKVPQLFVSTGASVFADPAHYSWTIGYNPNYQTEARIYGKHILATKPDGKIGVLYQNDGFGKDYLIGLKDALGGKSGMIVQGGVLRDKRADGQLAGRDPARLRRRHPDHRRDPEIRRAGDPQILRSRLERRALSQQRLALDRDRPEARRPRKVEGPDHRLLRKGPDRREVEGRSRHDGVEGVLRQVHVADRVPRRQRDLRLRRGRDYDPRAQACGNDFSRDNVMKQATNIKELELPMLLPGMHINTSPTNYSPIRQMQLASFDGQSWQLFGELLMG